VVTGNTVDKLDRLNIYGLESHSYQLILCSTDQRSTINKNKLLECGETAG